MSNKRLEEIYSQIPEMECIEGCTDCCGPVTFSNQELLNISDRRYFMDDESCPYSRSGCCEIHSKRPFMCRLFGTVDDDRIRCPHGCRPKTMLSPEKAKELIKKYKKYIRRGLI